MNIKTVLIRFDYKSYEERELRECLRYQIKSPSDSISTCCLLFWKHVFCHGKQSFWKRAHRTLVQRTIGMENGPVTKTRTAIFAKFLLNHLITQARSDLDQNHLLQKKPDPIDFFDLFHCGPYSEGDSLSIPNMTILAPLFKTEYDRLTTLYNRFLPPDETENTSSKKRSIKTLRKHTRQSTKGYVDFEPITVKKSEEVRQFLENHRYLLDSFETLKVEDGYKYFKELKILRESFEKLCDFTMVQIINQS